MLVRVKQAAGSAELCGWRGGRVECARAKSEARARATARGPRATRRRRRRGSCCAVERISPAARSREQWLERRRCQPRRSRRRRADLRLVSENSLRACSRCTSALQGRWSCRYSLERRGRRAPDRWPGARTWTEKLQRFARPRRLAHPGRPSARAAARPATTSTTAALSAVAVSPLMAGAAGAVAASAGWLDSAPLRDYWTALAAVLALCLLGTFLVHPCSSSTGSRRAVGSAPRLVERGGGDRLEAGSLATGTGSAGLRAQGERGMEVCRRLDPAAARRAVSAT